MITRNPQTCSILLAPIVLLLLGVVPYAQQKEHRAIRARVAVDDTKAQELFRSALLDVQLRNWEPARRRMQEAVLVWTQMSELGKAARALTQLGDSYLREPNYPACLYFYKQVLQIRQLPRAMRAGALISIARVYAELSNTELAIDYFNKGLEQARIAGDRSVQLLALSGLADVHYRKGDNKRALAEISRAREVTSQQDRTEANLLQTSARLHQEEGQLEPAKGAFEKALAIYRTTGDVEAQVKVLCFIADLHLAASRKEEALARAMEAWELTSGQSALAVSNADKTRVRSLAWRAWLARARAERATGKTKSAASSFQWAFSQAEARLYLAEIATENGAIAFREETQAIYREYADLLMEQAAVSRAYGIAERAKAQSIRRLTQARRNRLSTGQGSRAEPFHSGRQLVARLRTQLLYDQPAIERAIREKELRDAEHALEELRIRAEVDSSRDRLVVSTPATAESVQAAMSRQKAAVLEFLMGETRSFVWLITADGISFEILPNRKEIEEAVGKYLTMLAKAPNPIRLETETAKTRVHSELLFSKLFGKLGGQIIPGQKLIIVPDGLLHYLPFETLIRQHRYLVADHEISYAPSASMLGLWQESPNQHDNLKKMEILAFGDPSFDPRSNKTNRKKTVGKIGDLAQAMRSSRRDLLPSIPRTRDEVEYVASLFPADRRRVYLGKESTEEAVKRESLRDYKRIHFATHSLIDEASPARSAVMFTLDSDEQEDGVLEVGEISELDIDCDLVVLSACQTGRGKLVSGEGIVGISRSFLGAGARGVAVSLWDVSDVSTSRFMKTLYQHLAEGAGNAAALRAAKLRMIAAGGALEHPHYWAPFVLIGKP